MEKIILKDDLPDGTIKKREIKRITKEEARDYKLLGGAVAENYHFCLYLAHKYCPNFRERVVAFSVVEKNKVSKIMGDATKRNFKIYEFYEK